VDAAALASVPLFSDVPDEVRAEFAARCQQLDVLGGHHLATEGDYGYKFFVVLSGRVSVRTQGRVVTTLGPGDFFGEMALRGGQRRNADVVAETRTVLGRMMIWDFEELLGRHPDVCARVNAEIARRSDGPSSTGPT
jgi:monovalent cation:H+ antiporter-2, CPA2 family